ATVRRTNPPTRTPTPTQPPLCNRCTISGRVYTSQGQPVPKTSVNVYTAAGALVGTTTADANGFYSITVLAGRYKMYFNPPYQNMVAQWFNGRGSLATADVITVDRATTISPSIGLR